MSKLGDLLKEKREADSITIQEVSVSLKISKDILVLLEDGKYYSLPSYVYAYGFVKKYAEFLKMDFNEIKDIFDEECKKENFNSTLQGISTQKLEREVVENKVLSKKLIFLLIIIGLIVLISLYVKYASDKSENFDSLNKNNKSKQIALKDNMSDNISTNNIIDNDNLSHDNKTVSEENEKINNNVINDKIKEKKQIDKKDIKEQDKIVIKKAKIVFSDICWIHLNIDNKTEVDFIANPEEYKTVEFEKFFLLDIGNAAAVSVKYGNKTITGFGGFRKPAKHLKFYLDENGQLVYSKMK